MVTMTNDTTTGSLVLGSVPPIDQLRSKITATHTAAVQDLRAMRAERDGLNAQIKEQVGLVAYLARLARIAEMEPTAGDDEPGANGDE